MSRLRAKVSDLLSGAQLVGVTRLEHSWALEFDRVGLTTGTSWRMIKNGRLVLTSSDDGQKFGLHQPVDSETQLQAALAGHQVTSCVVDPATADLTLDFDEGSRLEILSTSIGYEAWQLNSAGSCIVAGNQGRLSEATYAAPQVMIGGPWE